MASRCKACMTRLYVERVVECRGESMSQSLQNTPPPMFPNPLINPPPPLPPPPRGGSAAPAEKEEATPPYPKKTPLKNRTERSGSPLLFWGIFFKKNPQKVEGLLGSFWEALGSFWEASGSSGKLPRPGEASPHFAGSRERRFRLFEQGRQNHQSPNRKSTVQ